MTEVSEPAADAGNPRRARVSGGALQNRMPENAMKPSDIKPTVMKVMPRP